MFRHNFKLAYRNSLRDKSTFLINLVGLSTGLACTLLIALWVMDELKVDKFHKNDAQLYQVMVNQHLTNGIKTDINTQGLLADALEAEVPEIEMAVSTSEAIPTPFILNYKGKKINAFGNYADNDFFELFSFPLVEGNPNTALRGKKSIAISDKLAMKIFNSTAVIGKTLDWQILHWKGAATISSVFKATGTNSSQQFEILLPFDLFKDMMGKRVHWGNYIGRTYVLLKKNTDVNQLNKRLASFIKEHADWEKNSLFLKPYSERYLYGKYENGKQVGGRIEYVRLFSIIAIFILLIACINFMNLSTAKATKKLKEVGVRKTIGANRGSLIQQYLGESIFMSLLALATALLLVRIVLPHFNLLTGKELIFPFNLTILLTLLGVAILTGIIAGSYPALYLSSFSPAKVLKGAINRSTGELWLRKILVVFQFTMSIILIVAVLVVYQQIEFIQNKNIGYQKENVITFPKDGLAETNLESFLTRLKNLPGIVNASSTGHSIIAGGSATVGVGWPGKDPDENIVFGNIPVYYDFIETLGIELLSGRSFSKAFGTEENRLILNETAINTMGLTDPIGKKIKLWNKEVTIIGVVKDFHFESLHEAVQPMFLRLAPNRLMSIFVRIEAGKEKEAISRLANFYKETNPGYPFDYEFLDASFAAQYKAESKISALSRYFAGLAIIISCLGLFGLVAFSAQRRLKEIAVRKVLGASSVSIVKLLSIDFTKMVVVAIFIALPISYFLTKNWLEAFAYRIDLEWWFFVSAGVGALLIAWLTVSLQTIKAAQINPVKSLKME